MVVVQSFHSHRVIINISNVASLPIAKAIRQLNTLPRKYLRNIVSELLSLDPTGEQRYATKPFRLSFSQLVFMQDAEFAFNVIDMTYRLFAGALGV